MNVSIESKDDPRLEPYRNLPAAKRDRSSERFIAESEFTVRRLLQKMLRGRVRPGDSFGSRATRSADAPGGSALRGVQVDPQRDRRLSLSRGSPGVWTPKPIQARFRSVGGVGLGARGRPLSGRRR